MSVIVILGLLFGLAEAIKPCGKNLCRDCLVDGIYGIGNGHMVWKTDRVGLPSSTSGICESSSHDERGFSWDFGAYRNGTEFSVIELGTPQFLCNGQQALDSILSKNQTLATESDGPARLLQSKSVRYCSPSLCDEMWEDGYYSLPPNAEGLPKLHYKKFGDTKWIVKCWPSNWPGGQFLLYRTNGESRLGVGAWAGSLLYVSQALSCPAVRHSERRRLDVAEERHTARSPTIPLQESSVLI